MVDGGLLRQRWKIGWLLRSDAKSSTKGGDTMSEIRGKLVDTLEGVLTGKTPLDTAEAVHKIAHRHVMDRYADDKEARRVGEAKIVEQLNQATEAIKKI